MGEIIKKFSVLPIQGSTFQSRNCKNRSVRFSTITWGSKGKTVKSGSTEYVGLRYFSRPVNSSPRVLQKEVSEFFLLADNPFDGETMETVSGFISGGSKITADGDCSHEIKRCLLLGRKVMTNLDSILKSRDITLPTKVRLVKAMVFPVVMYECESWTIKKVEH